MSPDDKKYRQPAGGDDSPPIEAPPPYSEFHSPAYQNTAEADPGLDPAVVVIQNSLSDLQRAIRAVLTTDHEALQRIAPGENCEIRTQVLHVISHFVRSIQKDCPRSPQELPPGARGVLQASLYLAPQHAVPLSDGWHLSGTSEKDNLILGRVVKEARVEPTETQSAGHEKTGKKAADALRQEAASEPGLWSGLGASSWAEAARPEGRLWWNSEREARRISEDLSNGLMSSARLQGAGVSGDPYARVRMTILAEETTFRRLNDMEMWESKSGWTIVVEVSLKY